MYNKHGRIGLNRNTCIIYVFMIEMDVTFGRWLILIFIGKYKIEFLYGETTLGSRHTDSQLFSLGYLSSSNDAVVTGV